MPALAISTHAAHWDLHDAIRGGRPVDEVLALLDAYDEVRDHEAGAEASLREQHDGEAFDDGFAAGYAEGLREAKQRAAGGAA